MFDHIRHADRMVLFLNCVLLMDIAVIPFAAAVLANAFRAGQGERTAVVVHGIVFELAAAVFNVIWWYARRDRRLLANTIDAAGARSIARRFLLGLVWIGGGTLLGALLPLLGVAVFASFIIFSGCRSPVRSAWPGPARYRPARGHGSARPVRKRNLARTSPLPGSKPGSGALIGYGEGVGCFAAMTTDRRLAAVPRLL